MPRIEAALAVNRFGLGARPGEMAQAAADPRSWLLRQLDAEAPLPPGLAGLPPGSEPLGRLRSAYRDHDKEAEQEARRYGEALYRAEAAARLRAQVETALPFRERLVAFWSNHFTVSRRRGDITGLACAFEREAIRPHVAGRFRDMLGAVIRHPAMLVYLDNQSSLGPNSREGRARSAGLNENLARELLELHTLGAGGGYGQADVTELARVLTGWRVSHEGRFRFAAAAHEPGPKSLLGRPIEASGRREARLALDMLASQPSTARHVATALARHFAADPPPSLIDRLARTFVETGGDLKALAAALVASPEAWSGPGRAKSPHEFVVSALRAFGAAEPAYGGPKGDERLLRDLRAMGQPPFDAPSPAGWPDDDAAWMTPEALMQRLSWALWLGQRLGAEVDAGAAAERALGPMLRPDTRRAMARAASRPAAVAILIASPEFQRR